MAAMNVNWNVRNMRSFHKAENADDENAYDENANDEKADNENAGQDASDCAQPAMKTSMTFVTPSHPPPQPSGCSPPPWTPPPTPPCSKCGANNYGPCPGSVCFSCTPHLQASSRTRSSPSSTPPGTPPPSRRSHQSDLTYNQLTASNSKL